MKSVFTYEDLREIVTELSPVELKGVVLLRQHRPQGQFFPQAEGISREAVSEAISEIISYTQQCQRMGSQLDDLLPMPLVGVDLTEYGL